MSLGITIRMGASRDTVTFAGNGKEFHFDRHEMRKNKQFRELDALNHHVVEETGVLKDRDRRRTRRAYAEKYKTRH